MTTGGDERRQRVRRGRGGELWAGAALRLNGYRILARRHRTMAGEIDLIAVRGQRLAFIEVKRRPSLDQAQSSVTDRQRARVRRAADLWLARHPRYHDHDICFDLVFILPMRWPQHLPNAL